jgi:hypothetical protein
MDKAIIHGVMAFCLKAFLKFCLSKFAIHHYDPTISINSYSFLLNSLLFCDTRLEIKKGENN